MKKVILLSLIFLLASTNSFAQIIQSHSETKETFYVKTEEKNYFLDTKVNLILDISHHYRLSQKQYTVSELTNIFSQVSGWDFVILPT